MRTIGWMALISTTLVGVVALHRPAQAQTQTSTAFVGSRFQPLGGSTDILGISGAQVPPHERIGVVAYANYAHNLLRLVNDSTGQELHLLANRLALDIGGTIGLYDRFEVSAILPINLWQNGDAAGFIASSLQYGPVAWGLGDIRITPKARLWKSDLVTVGASLPISLPSGRSGAYMGWGAVTAAPQVAAEVALPFDIRLLGNTGVALRPTRTFVQSQIGSAWTYGVGAEYPLPAPVLQGNLRVFATVQGEVVFDEPSVVGKPIEGLVGAGYQTQPDWSVLAGIGKGFNNGYGDPELRVLVGLFYNPLLEAPPPPPPPPPAPPPPPPDKDGDGVADPNDLCPDVAAGHTPDPNRAGCPEPDTDGDGIADSADACPQVPAGANPDPKKPGCPDPDTDSDGYVDSKDACPDVPAGLHADPNNLGCPLPDRDHDAVPDNVDACPDAAGAPSSVAAKNGCPGVVQIKGNQIQTLRPVLFATGTAKLLSKSFPVLEGVAEAMRTQDSITRLSIEGHTDNQGDAKKNQKLSEARAEACRAWLVAHGIAADRLEAHGYGQDRPIASNKTTDGRATNRRVDFKVIAVNGAAVPASTLTPPAPAPALEPVKKPSKAAKPKKKGK